MERLTNKREADAQRKEYERRLANGYPRNIPEERFLRLASYEDSGCEPEEVLPKDKADEVALKLMRLADLESLCNYTRLRELAEADRNHQIVIRPCKIGDTVWRIKRTFEEYPDKSKPYIEPDAFLLQDVFNIGKTVFLSREEAEKALQEMEGKKDGNKTSM